MGRYKEKMTHSFSTDPTRPMFDETVQMARKVFLNNYLDRLPLEEQMYMLQRLKEGGYIL